MKIAALAVTASLLALAGCAGMPGMSRSSQPVAADASGTYYCWRNKLEDRGTSFVCNWERSVYDACESHGIVTLSKSSIAGGTTQPSKRCENGQWLVSVTTR